ncbi:MAG: iron-sulfur cluster assembly scaffold protein [Nanoarchaeota archaeon]
MDDHLSREMYKEHILDLNKHPHNFGKIEAGKSHRSHNPLCGDDITMYIVEDNARVVDVKFSGRACSICMASASLITDKIKGMPIKEIMKLNKEDVLSLLQIPVSAVRLKCALLPLESIHQTLGENNDAA